ncbi:MAG: hypothetical protein WBH47_18265, partial [Streptosporangiaceae bacterium]
MTTPVSPAGAQRAESYLRQRADEELAEASSLAQVQPTADDRATTAKACVARTAALAGALAAGGAIPDTTAVSVLDGLGAALVQRGLLPAAALPAEPATELLAEPPDTPSRQPDTVRAFPAGVTVECEIDGFGFPIRLRLGALVTDGHSTYVTWRADYTDPQLTGPQAPFKAPDPWVALNGVTAADDLGGSYQDMGSTYFGRFRGNGHFRWEGWSQLGAAPPDEARLLEVTLAGNPHTRIALDRAREPAVTAAELDPADAADRLVDAGSLTLLADNLVQRPGMQPSLGTVAMAADLLAAGVLRPASPSLARLAA